MYAVPNYPYDQHSIWNRNAAGLSGFDTTSMLTLAAVGLGLWYFIRRKR
jgi:hypothetical protein